MAQGENHRRGRNASQGRAERRSQDPEEISQKRPEKLFSSDGKCNFLVMETITKKRPSHSAETTTTGHSAECIITSISRILEGIRDWSGCSEPTVEESMAPTSCTPDLPGRGWVSVGL